MNILTKGKNIPITLDINQIQSVHTNPSITLNNDLSQILIAKFIGLSLAKIIEKMLDLVY
jgi:hypothetical protein